MVGYGSVSPAFSLFQRFSAQFISDPWFPFTREKKAAWNYAFVSSLTFTSIIRGTRARFYPLLDLNSMEPPIGPNSERGYFAALEQLINGRRMNFQILGHFFNSQYFARLLFSFGHFQVVARDALGHIASGSFVPVPLKAKRDGVKHSSASKAVRAG
jgi:hypothetical protein